jgi:hypothetical protein
VERRHRDSADRVRAEVERGVRDPGAFRAALLDVPPSDRDEWLNLVLRLGELPDDDPRLPTGCVPYLPSSVDVLLRVVERASIRADDVFVDVGAGLGRAGALVHLVSGASVIGVEIQPRLVAASRELAARLGIPQWTSVEGDAAELAASLAAGSIFFLYCPFGGERLTKLLAGLEAIARTRTIRVCCLDLPLPPCPWLTPQLPLSPDLAVYRSAR